MSTLLTRNITVKVETTLVTETCCSCGVIFGIGSSMQRQLVESHADFYCPNGHRQHYTGRNEADRLRDELKRANVRATSWKDQAETAERRRRAEKAAKTRLRNRISKGVCPCCQRSFTNLAEHMAGQHPDFSEST